MGSAQELTIGTTSIVPFGTVQLRVKGGCGVNVPPRNQTFPLCPALHEPLSSGCWFAGME
jgi:hypothetical protein